MVETTRQRILDEVDRRGVLLVHDAVLPSVTALVTGAPVRGSWWSHPMANTIYNALGALEHDVAVVRLLVGKSTLVARRLWPDLLAVGSAREPWQVARLADDAMALLDDIGRAPAPVVVDTGVRKAAEQLDRRLLVYPTEIHTAAGHHRKAYQSWGSWGRARHVVVTGDGARARAVFDAVLADHPRPRRGRLTPW